MKKAYNPKHRYVQKRLLRQRFKENGKHIYRTLGWSKSVYREWFRYAQLSPKPYPSEFGDLSAYGTEYSDIDIHQLSDGGGGKLNKNDDKEFNKWWKEVMDLFYEPSEQLNDRIVTKMGRDPNKKDWPIDENYLYLQIDLRDLDKSVIEFNNVIKKEYEKQKQKKKKFKFVSKAKFSPSLSPKNIRLQKLMTYRLAYDLKFNQNKSRIDTVIYLSEIGLMKKADTYDLNKEYCERNNKLGEPISKSVFQNEVKRV